MLKFFLFSCNNYLHKFFFWVEPMLTKKLKYSALWKKSWARRSLSAFYENLAQCFIQNSFDGSSYLYSSLVNSISFITNISLIIFTYSLKLYRLESSIKFKEKNTFTRKTHTISVIVRRLSYNYVSTNNHLRVFRNLFHWCSIWVYSNLGMFELKCCSL